MGEIGREREEERERNTLKEYKNEENMNICFSDLESFSPKEYLLQKDNVTILDIKIIQLYIRLSLILYLYI